MIEGLNSLDVYKATVMLLSGRPSKPVDVLFFHGRSYGDHADLFELAADLVHKGMVTSVALFNNEGERMGSSIPYEANPGKTWHKNQLIKHGVPEDRILFTAEGGTILNGKMMIFLD